MQETGKTTLRFIRINNNGSADNLDFKNYLGRWEYENNSLTGNSILNVYAGSQIVGSLKWNPSGAIEHIWVHPEREGTG